MLQSQAMSLVVKRQNFRDFLPELIFCLSLIPVCIWFHDRTNLRADTSLTFDHWWYFHTRLQAHELAQWNPFYFLGRVAVQWNHIPFTLLTPMLYFLPFDISTFRFIEVTQTYLYLIAFYLTGRMLKFGRIIAMLTVLVIATSGFRFWIALPELCYYLLPLAICSAMTIARSKIITPFAWSASTLIFVLGLLGMRLETIFHLSVFIGAATAAWLFEKRPKAWLKITGAIFATYVIVLASNAWQLGLLLHSTMENSRFTAEATAATSHSLASLVGSARWIFLSILQQPLLLCALINLTLLYFPKHWPGRSRVFTRTKVCVFIALQTVLFALALATPNTQPEWQFITGFVWFHGLGFFDLQRVLAIPIVMAILFFYVRPRADKQFLLANLLRDSVLFFIAMSVTQYSWQIWPVNLDRHYFFMHPIINWLMPLGIHGVLKNWGRWPIYTLLLFHLIGETGSLALFEFLNIPWNPSRAAFVELPFQVLFIGESLKTSARLFSLPRLKPYFSVLALGNRQNLGISTLAIVCVVALYRTLMPQADGFYLEQWPFAKVAVDRPIDTERDWFSGAYKRALTLQKASDGTPQEYRLHVPDETWANYPRMKYDFMPAFSQTLNTAPPYSSEIPYHLRLLLLGPAQAKNRIIPPHPEGNPLLSAKKAIEHQSQGRSGDVFNYLDQVLIEPHKISDYPVKQLMAELGSQQARVNILEHLQRFPSDEAEYDAIRSAYLSTQRLPNFVTTTNNSQTHALDRAETVTKPLESRWKIIEDKPESIRIAVSSNREAYLVLFDLFQNSGWTAMVSQNSTTTPTEIIRAYLGVRAIAIPAGESIVEFNFAIPGLRALLLLSLITFVALIICVGLSYFRRRPLRNLRRDTP